MLKKIEEEVTERRKAVSKPAASSSGTSATEQVRLVTLIIVCFQSFMTWWRHFVDILVLVLVIVQ